MAKDQTSKAAPAGAKTAAAVFGGVFFVLIFVVILYGLLGG